MARNRPSVSPCLARECCGRSHCPQLWASVQHERHRNAQGDQRSDAEPDETDRVQEETGAE